MAQQKLQTDPTKVTIFFFFFFEQNKSYKFVLINEPDLFLHAPI